MASRRSTNFRLAARVQDAKGAGNLQTPIHSGSIPSALVDKKEIGLERDLESDGSAFAGIEIGQGRIISAHSVENTQPSWGRFDPNLNCWWRPIMNA